MKKQVKIKRYHKINTGGTFRRTSPVTVVLSIIGLVALLFVGISIFPPVYNFIMGNIEPREPEPLPDPDPIADTETEPEPEPEPVRRRSSIQAVYLPASIAASDERLSQFIASLDGTGVDSVMIDIKDSNGNVLFASNNEYALAWGAAAEGGGGIDLAALADTLQGSGLSLTVRMSAFSDQLAARGDRANAINYQDTEWLWLDNAADAGGKPWLNPYSDSAKSYLTALAVEAVNAGATTVILQDVQFPDGSGSANASFGEGSSGVSRQQALQAFVREITAAVEEAGGQLGVYVTTRSVTQTEQNEVRYGGSPLDILDNMMFLGLLPYQFDATFSAGGLELEQVYEQPVETVRTALAYIQQQTDDEVRIVPLIQGGNESSVVVGPQELSGQIDVVQAAGTEGYVLYQSEGSYAFA